MEALGLRNFRAVLWLAVALLAFALECGAQASPPISAGILESVRPNSRLEVFYLGTPDCPYCNQWERKARAKLQEWAAANDVHYVEIRGETLRAPIVERHYPREHLGVYQQIGPSRGVPRFLLAIDGKVRLSAMGVYRYDEIFLPIVKQVAERRANQS
jgi:thioredoxin-related protein